LGSLGLIVNVVSSTYDEVPLPGCSPLETARLHAQGKLLGAAPNSGLTIAADTVVDLDGVTLGKPRDDAEASAMLSALSGREHQVHTAFALRLGTELRHLESVSTSVRFRTLEADLIAAYVASGDPFDKAGAYGIQGFAATLVERVDGDYFTVVGFPLGAFAAALPALGYRLLPGVRTLV
jgi:septum formation protein